MGYLSLYDCIQFMHNLGSELILDKGRNRLRVASCTCYDAFWIRAC